jgi:hypothetical protein
MRSDPRARRRPNPRWSSRSCPARRDRPRSTDRDPSARAGTSVIEYRPPVMFAQKAAASGASGMIAPMPTTATGELGMFEASVHERVPVIEGTVDRWRGRFITRGGRRARRRRRSCHRAIRPGRCGSRRAGMAARSPATSALPGSTEPATQRTPSCPTRWAASRAKTRDIAASAGPSKRSRLFSWRDPVECCGSARWANTSAHSVVVIRSPRRNRTCWFRVRRATRHDSSTAASAFAASAAAVGTDGRVGAVQLRERRRFVAVVRTRRLQVLLPSVASDRHLHDLRRALVDRRDADVALDLLHDVLAGVSVPAVGLDGCVGSCVACLRGHQLRDRTLGVHRPIGAEAPVELVGRVLDEGPRSFESHGVRDDQLVGEALLLRQRRATLLAFDRVGDRPVECFPATAEAECSDHEARVPEHLLGLDESLALDLADEVIEGDLDIVEEEGRGVGESDAVFVLRMRRREARVCPSER